MRQQIAAAMRRRPRFEPLPDYCFREDIFARGIGFEAPARRLILGHRERLLQATDGFACRNHIDQLDDSDWDVIKCRGTCQANIEIKLPHPRHCGTCQKVSHRHVKLEPDDTMENALVTTPELVGLFLEQVGRDGIHRSHYTVHPRTARPPCSSLHNHAQPFAAMLRPSGRHRQASRLAWKRHSEKAIPSTQVLLSQKRLKREVRLRHLDQSH